MAFTVALGIFVTAIVGVSAGAAGWLGLLPLVVVWGFGVLASARVDDTGLRWRWFARHVHPWSQVEAIRFGSRFVTGGPVGASSPAVFVTAGGREHPIRPTYGCSRSARTDFDNALAAIAAAHGVPASVTNAGWEELDTQQVSSAPFATPGVSRSPQNTRIRVGLFGLGMLVIGVLGLVGAVTGWDSSGTNPVVLSVIGGVLLVIGGLVLALMLVTGP